VKVLRALPANPYVAAYRDHGSLPDGSLFLVSEFVAGFTLGRLLASGRRFSEQAACALMLQLCKAFNGLHRLGVTHGDIKPNNVMLTKPASAPGLSQGESATKVIHLAQIERSAVGVRLLDFGLVRDAQGLLNLFERHRMLPGRDFEEELDAGMLTGTPEYIAPEQLADARREPGMPTRTDTPADVFALGVVFYEMLTGTVPWPFVAADDDTEDMLALKVKNYLDRRAAGQTPTPPRGIGRALWSVIARTLDPDPKLRPRDAAALAEDLERYMEFGIGVTPNLDTQATMLAQLGPDLPGSVVIDLPPRRRDTSPSRSESRPTSSATVEEEHPFGRSSLLSLLQVPAKAKQTILRYSPQSRWSQITLAAVALAAVALVVV
jgi:serine/threonine-protein kinase